MSQKIIEKKCDENMSQFKFSEDNIFFNFFLVQISLNITLKEGDTIFQRPLTRTQPILLPGEEEKRRNSTLPDPNRTNLMIPPGGTVCQQ